MLQHDAFCKTKKWLTTDINVTTESARNGHINTNLQAQPASVSEKRKQHFYESSWSSEVNTKHNTERGASKLNTVLAVCCATDSCCQTAHQTRLFSIQLHLNTELLCIPLASHKAYTRYDDPVRSSNVLHLLNQGWYNWRHENTYGWRFWSETLRFEVT